MGLYRERGKRRRRNPEQKKSLHCPWGAKSRAEPADLAAMDIASPSAKPCRKRWEAATLSQAGTTWAVCFKNKRRLRFISALEENIHFQGLHSAQITAKSSFTDM